MTEQPITEQPVAEHNEAIEVINYGGFWRRFWAQLIDGLLIIAITYPLLYIAYGEQYFIVEESEDVFQGFLDIFLSIIAPALAVILFWVYKSSTPGKMILGLTIVHSETGENISTGQSVGRYFAYILSALPFMLGYIWAAFDKRKQGWHDKLCKTIVIRK